MDVIDGQCAHIPGPDGSSQSKFCFQILDWALLGGACPSMPQFHDPTPPKAFGKEYQPGSRGRPYEPPLECSRPPAARRARKAQRRHPLRPICSPHDTLHFSLWRSPFKISDISAAFARACLWHRQAFVGKVCGLRLCRVHQEPSQAGSLHLQAKVGCCFVGLTCNPRLAITDFFGRGKTLLG